MMDGQQTQDRAIECQSVGTPEVGEGLKTILLTPDGAVESANGRFVVDAEGAAMMVESFDRQGVEIPVDFEHQTLGGPYSAPDGRAPAAGWVTKIWYEIGRGVSAFVRWNAKTREAIREGAYGYVSPVLLVRKSDLKAIGLHSVGLTNKPAIVGLARIAASTRLTDTERKPMADGTMMDASAMLGELAGLLDIKLKATARPYWPRSTTGLRPWLRRRRARKSRRACGRHLDYPRTRTRMPLLWHCRCVGAAGRRRRSLRR